MWWNDLSFDDMLKRSAALPPKSAIFFFSLLVDAAGRSHEGEKSFANLRAVASAPIFTHIDTKFGNGVVGGPFYSTIDMAQHAASAAMRILGGEVAERHQDASGRIWHAEVRLERTAALEHQRGEAPPGSDIQFRASTVWEQYRWQSACRGDCDPDGPDCRVVPGTSAPPCCRNSVAYSHGQVGASIASRRRGNCRHQSPTRLTRRSRQSSAMPAPACALAEPVQDVDKCARPGGYRRSRSPCFRCHRKWPRNVK